MKKLTCMALFAIFAYPALGRAQALEKAGMTTAPNVPPAVARKKPAVVEVELEARETDGELMEGLNEPTKYHFWTFNGTVPAPFIRMRQGDTMELTIHNSPKNTMPHNVDFHAVTGPGGGAAITQVQPGETKKARFKMLYPGLFVYHCAAPPVSDHIANGMYGLLLVEPETPLPPADREFYVMQSEFYTKEEMGAEGMVSYDSAKASAEMPTYVVFNGKHGSLLEDGALQAKVGEKVRIYFGNAGPNKTASFHLIGAVFDKVWREGAIGAAPAENVQTTVVPPGGAAIVDWMTRVPGNYTLVDHAIFRLEKGAMGTIKVAGPEAPEIYRTVK